MDYKLVLKWSNPAYYCGLLIVGLISGTLIALSGTYEPPDDAFGTTLWISALLLCVLFPILGGTIQDKINRAAKDRIKKSILYVWRL